MHLSRSWGSVPVSEITPDGTLSHASDSKRGKSSRDSRESEKAASEATPYEDFLSHSEP